MPAPPARRAPWAGLPSGFGVLWGTVAVDLVGFGIVVPLLPLYARRLGAGPEAIGLLLAAYSAAQLVCAPLLGRLSDRVGRKPVLVLALAGTAAASVLTGLAGSLWLLFLARVLDGASGGSVSVAQAAATDVVGRPERARVLGLLGAAYGVGFVLGPAIGGLAALGGARLPFFVAGAIAAVNAVAAVRRLPETHRRAAHVADEVVLEAGSPASGDDGIVGTLRRIAVPAALTVLVVAAFSAFEATFPLFGQHRLGFGLAATGAVFAGVGVVSAGVQGLVVRPAVHRFGDAATLRAGLACEAVGLALLSEVHTRVALVAPLALVTAGQALCTPTLASLVAGRVGDADRGGALGTQQGGAALARIVGPALGGACYGLLGAGAPLLGGGLVLAGALALSLVLRGGLENVPVSVGDGGTGRLPLSNNG
jgi:DHA1 family tetracycline resistance protein-like MFS transporter